MTGTGEWFGLYVYPMPGLPNPSCAYSSLELPAIVPENQLTAYSRQ